MSDKADKKKKDKKGKGGDAGPDVSLRAHPRAKAGIRKARFGGGLACLLIGAVMAHRAGVPTQDVLLRALLAGIAGHLVAWAGAIFVFRAVARGEIQRAITEREERFEAARARIAEQAAMEG